MHQKGFKGSIPTFLAHFVEIREETEKYVGSQERGETLCGKRAKGWERRERRRADGKNVVTQCAKSDHPFESCHQLSALIE